MDYIVDIPQRSHTSRATIVVCPKVNELPVNIQPCSVGPAPPAGQEPPNGERAASYAGAPTRGQAMVQAIMQVLGKQVIAPTMKGSPQLVRLARVNGLYVAMSYPEREERRLVAAAPAADVEHPENNAASFAYYTSGSYDVGLLETPWFQGGWCIDRNFLPERYS
ncbi:MAG: hypothetical protein M1833_005285 [Piccolia ochrophora]|nr:MAG: hypothetical protein M1833_005285 [Piccolia ochrophora]